MKVLIIGSPKQTAEFEALLPADADPTIGHDIEEMAFAIPNFKLIFDLSFDQAPNRLTYYSKAKGAILVAGSVIQSLAQAVHQYGKPAPVTLVGWNTLPTFIDRPVMECSVLDEADKPKGEEVGRLLGREVQWVADRVGMVTPRILLMLINEACYTHQEGTASMQDIDLGMRLGTNYPRGPLAWADAIGVDVVHRALEALHRDTGDERYRISPLLRKHYLTGSAFTD